jgi:2-iminobutanoate/2-iminopropanoate deaminase
MQQTRPQFSSAKVILADEDDFAGMNEEWMRWLPARIPGLKISIAVIAEA